MPVRYQARPTSAKSNRYKTDDTLCQLSALLGTPDLASTAGRQSYSAPASRMIGRREVAGVARPGSANPLLRGSFSMCHTGSVPVILPATTIHNDPGNQTGVMPWSTPASSTQDNNAMGSPFSHRHRRGTGARFTDDMLGDEKCPVLDAPNSRPLKVDNPPRGPVRDWASGRRSPYSVMAHRELGETGKGSPPSCNIRVGQQADFRVGSTPKLSPKAARIGGRLGAVSESIVHGNSDTYRSFDLPGWFEWEEWQGRFSTELATNSPRKVLAGSAPISRPWREVLKPGA